MARIAVTRAGDSYRITLDGRLTARDLRRLERACRDALEQEHVLLDISLERVTSIDDAADVYLERLRARGARLSGQRKEPENAQRKT